VFVDSGAFFGLIVADDAHHARAEELFRQAEASRWELVTTNIVVAETHALLLSRLRGDRRVAMAFLESIETDGYLLETVTRDDHNAAVALLGANDDKGYSLCDALSFVVMERLGISQAIAFDRHFRQYGRFTIL
jgi:predicted nucleic acid-binding protein